MSTAIMQQSALFDFGDAYIKNQTDAMQPMNPSATNMLIPYNFQIEPPNADEWILAHQVISRAASLPISASGTMGSSLPQQALTNILNNFTQMRLDRTNSEPIPARAPLPAPVPYVPQAPSHPATTSRYKTELCRPFEEAGVCKYGEKCQFAHGVRELRKLQRHPKYKTEQCRTFHSVGYCPYGTRCHFVHTEEIRRLRQASTSYNSLLSISSGVQSDGTHSPRSSLTPHSTPSPVTPLSPAMSPPIPGVQNMAFVYGPPYEIEDPLYNPLRALGDILSV